MAIFSISGNHVGYEDQLNIPTNINLQGAKLQVGPLAVPLEGLALPIKIVTTLLNSTLIRAAEVIQYKAYFLSPLLVSPWVSYGTRVLTRKCCACG